MLATLIRNSSPSEPAHVSEQRSWLSNIMLNRACVATCTNMMTVCSDDTICDNPFILDTLVPVC